MISYVVVGPQRTASSWLDRVLRTHPHLSLPADVKETFFFDRYYDRGYSWYYGLFDNGKEAKYSGEVGPTYFESTVALGRILSHNPEIKVIVLIRNPVARSFSSFAHEYAKGRSPQDFFEAIRTQPRIIDAGRYGCLAPAWEKAVKEGNLLYLVQEDIESNPQEQVDKVCRFLGVMTMGLDETLSGRYGQGSVPRFPLLAALASRMAAGLRSVGLHKFVELGKRLGLKNVYEGGDPGKLRMTRPIFDHLLAEHETDIDFIETCLERSFPHWRDPETYGFQEGDQAE